MKDKYLNRAKVVSSFYENENERGSAERECVARKSAEGCCLLMLLVCLSVY